MSRPDTATLRRRRFLATLGASGALGLAGCGGDGGSADGSDGPTPTPTATPEDVPAEYETATALNGQERDPGALSTKNAVDYQAEPSGNEKCSNCAYYIEDKNGDGMGACAIVDGTIDPDGWCVSYVRYEGADTATPAEESLGAVDVPADADCAVCEMTAADFPEWNGQAVHDDGTRVFFCSSGCATTYATVPDQFAETDAAIAGLWVTDFETGARIDGLSADYVLETDSDRVDDPMRLNPAPFASREDAVAYVEGVDYLTSDDIVAFSAFDRDVVTEYRGRFLDG